MTYCEFEYTTSVCSNNHAHGTGAYGTIGPLPVNLFPENMSKYIT